MKREISVTTVEPLFPDEGMVEPKVTDPPCPGLRLIGQCDRRVAPRTSSAAAFMVTFRDGSGERLAMATVRVVNTSATGAGVVCPCEVAPGTQFTLCAPRSPFSGRTGHVAWCRPTNNEGEFALGLRFVQAKAA